MASITDIVVSVHPSSDSIGIILKDTIWVLFDREIDENSVNEGNFLIEGPDTDSFIGPDIGLNLPDVSDSGSDDQLLSPGYKGIVPGTISFQKINLLDTNIYTGPLDTAAAGNLWRTKAIFTPSFPLQAITKYRIYLAGDENTGDTNPTGVRSRTIFDPIDDVGNTGSGIVTFSGSYTGVPIDTYNIQITIDGASGTAWYEWWKTSIPLEIHGPIQTNTYSAQLLDNNVYIKFNDGNFEVDDAFTVKVKPPVLFIGNTYWDFTTGTGSIATLPESTSTSITGDPMPLAADIFSLVSIVPADRATNLVASTKRITLTFNKNINPTTVTADTVSLLATAVNGDPNILGDRKIYKDITVTGNKIIIDF